MLDSDKIISSLDGTHGYVVGSSNSGKTSYLLWFMQELLLKGKGFCYIDWHGQAYHDILDYLAFLHPRVPVYLMDTASEHWVLPYNPFALKEGVNLSLHVERCVTAAIRPFGAKDTKDTPRLDRIGRLLFHFAAVTKETVPNVWNALWFGAQDVRNYAMRVITDTTQLNGWKELESVKNLQQWLGQVESTRNRLNKLCTSDVICRHIGLKRPSLSIPQVLNSGGVLLVNIPAARIGSESAGAFAALLLLDFFQAAMQRVGQKKPKLFYLILDEFQNYITPDLASSLDQARKGGLRLVLSHQREGQLSEARDLESALKANAQVTVNFGEKQRQCSVKIPGNSAVNWEVPDVQKYYPLRKTSFVESCMKRAGAVSVKQADEELALSAKEFQEKVRPSGRGRANRSAPKPL